MDLSGTYTFDTNQEAVWNILMDPDAIAKAIPGVDQFVPIEGETDSWRVQMKVSVSAINGKYGGTIQLSDKEPPNQYRLNVTGEGQQSIIGGSALIHLDYNEAEQQTILHWDAEANISGKLARIGQRVVKAAANMMANRFFGSLADQIQEAEGRKENQ